MKKSLINYLCEQPLMKVLRSFVLVSQPRYIRELAAQHSLSPAGVADIIGRLKKTGVLRQKKEKNRLCYFLDVSVEEMLCLRALFSQDQVYRLEKRACRFRGRAGQRFKWMAQASEVAQAIKEARR